MTGAIRPEIAYWQNFYAGSGSIDEPSDFARFALQEMANYSTVLELGCGNGRDSMFFLEQGKRVLGIDACGAAIETCKSKVAACGFDGSKAAFVVAEAGSREAWSALSSQIDGPVAIYARFLLHAIEESDEDALLDHAEALIDARGGILLAEFRTPADARLEKQAPPHFRRYVDPARLETKLRQRGLAVVYRREGQGMARYGSEDAFVARMIAWPAVSFGEQSQSPALARLQQVQKQVAGNFFRWCDRHGLTAFLVCGSALGAVRHGDMIPWDDDIDIGMLRSDFERLFECHAIDPLPSTSLQSHRNERRYPFPFAKLRLDGTSVLEPAFTSSKAHNGIFIDIFPFDSLPRSLVLRRLQRLALGALNLFIMPTTPHLLAATPSRSIRLVRTIAGWLQPALPLRLLIAMRERCAKLAWANKCEILDSFGMYGIQFGPKTPIAADALVPPSATLLGETQVWLPRDSEGYLQSLFGDFRRLPREEDRRPGHIIAVDFGVLPATSSGVIGAGKRELAAKNEQR